MTIEGQITKLLIDLINQLPPDVRHSFGNVLVVAATTQPYWTPAAIAVLAMFVAGCASVYAEAVGG